MSYCSSELTATSLRTAMGSSSSRKPHSQEQDLAAELEPAEPEAALGEAAELCSEEQCRMPFGWENKIVRMVRSIQP